jgi:hypothetical protein
MVGHQLSRFGPSAATVTIGSAMAKITILFYNFILYSILQLVEKM